MDTMAPIWIKPHKGQRAKRWLLIFTCEVFRAIRIEILHSLSTDSVILAIEQLCARQTQITHILCDNAPGFRGVQSELEKLLKQVDGNKLSGRLPELKLEFGPGHAPHFQGGVEIKVKALKRAMVAAFPPGELNDEGLLTAAAVIEPLKRSERFNDRKLVH